LGRRQEFETGSTQADAQSRKDQNQSGMTTNIANGEKDLAQ
jgi:hypothetical protein